MQLFELTNETLATATQLTIALWPECNFEEEYENCKKILSSKKETIFLAQVKDEYIGFIHVSLRYEYVEGTSSSPVAYIEGIYVKPNFRKTGIGKILVEKGEVWGWKNGAKEYASDTEIENQVSIDFHQQLGFKEANRIVNFSKKINPMSTEKEKKQTGIVLALSVSPTHTMKKFNQESIQLLEGLGVEGDAHMGKTVKHRSRVRKDPTQPNLRQIHLIHSELHEELKTKGFQITPGQMGENITTQGIDLLSLPKDTILKIGAEAEVQITGLRNPCNQLNGIQDGLMKAVLDRDDEGNLIRKSGIMGIVLKGGKVNLADRIEIVFPPRPFVRLERV